MSGSDSPAVELEHVSKIMADRPILDDVTLQVRRGEFFALIGPSGSGKSTLLKMVSGIDTPTQGMVRLAGSDVNRVPPYRRPVHTVFQSYALFPHLDVAGNVGFPLRIAGRPWRERQERVHQALGWVRLEGFGRRRIDSLSGGERQRVALARALVDHPQCVLLDEPLAALDPHLRGHTLELLQEIQQRLELTYIYVTHDRLEALRAAHRIGVLHQGRLQQIGTPQELYHRPASAFVAGFVGPISWLEGDFVLYEDRPALILKAGERVPVAGTPAGASGRMQLGLRPEDIRLGQDGFFTAEVVQRQFCGSTLSLRLETEDGTLLSCERGDGDCPAKVGDRVQVSWEPAKALVFASAR
jgi:ABC-type Fe3+/spermidine/putrescine transport system ATPase subunit